ncbi:MAG: VWA domain-containing protein [Propionibacteriales bacterium]|nr:VWA domain-containing protein [Propionibacteriales bacterium]
MGFARALRHAGLAVTQDRSQTFLRACAQFGHEDRAGAYWAGRATLCSGPDDLDRYDRVFEGWFSGTEVRATRRDPAPRRVAQADLGGADGMEGSEDGDTVTHARASRQEVLRRRDVAELDARERAELNRLFATLRPRSPVRSSARRTASHRGEIDARRTLRDHLRRAGEPGPVRYRRRGVRPRRVVLLVDVSGSMAPYADSLLRLAHRVVRSAPRRTEVFTIGTRLTRVTHGMQQRDPEAALRAAGEAVPDWSGGTRLGDVLGSFLRRWGHRGPARGAVVVVFSDGWERGDCEVLGREMARLARLAHRVVWANPHRGHAGYEPLQGGIAAALPHVDHFVAGHSLESFADVLDLVAEA